MKIILEQLTTVSAEDREAIKRLVAQLGDTYKPLTEDDIQEIITKSMLLVARDSQTHQLVGMTTLMVYRIPYLRKAYLDDLIIDESYRGQGIGSQLLQEALKRAKSVGASFVELTSNPKRISSNKLYQKLGFALRETNVYRFDLENKNSNV